MANNIFTSVGDWLARRIAGYIQDDRAKDYGVLGAYYTGDHRAQLTRKPGAQDENLIENFVGLAVDRSVSRLLRGGVKFQVPEGAEAQAEYLQRVWDLNKQEILLEQLGLHGAVYGTVYVKILPDEMPDMLVDGDPIYYPRLVALDPEVVRIVTDPQDMQKVRKYHIEYTIKERVGFVDRERSFREITRLANEADRAYDEDGKEQPVPEGNWIVESWERIGADQWQMVMVVIWPYNFPPILHWKNLPSLKSCYGDSEIDDVINVQDKNNFVVSNTAKIIKYHAHPQTIGTGFSVKDMGIVEGAVNTFRTIPAPEAKVFNLEMSSDLASSRAFAHDLRQAIFDISREVDIASMADKLGALTNFGLRVLYTDAIDKNDLKRQLYGDALIELNRRLLVIEGYEGSQSDPGTVQWGDALPVNITEEMTADKQALELGIIDKETVAMRYKSRYGLDWEDIQERLAKQKEADNENEDNIGSLILRNFIGGGGGST